MEKNKAIEFFKGDIFATVTTGIVIEEASDGSSLCRLEIEPRHLNQMKNVMGGAIYTLADFAVAVAANTDDTTSVSLSGSINYLAPAKGKTLFAKADTVKSGRSVSVYECTVTDELGTKVAYAVFNSFNIRKDG